MLELIPMPRDDVIGLRIDGRLDESDVERCVAALDRAFEVHERVRLYVEVAAFGGIALGALVADWKFAFAHLRDFERKAVVSDLRWAELLAKAGDVLFSGTRVRHFTPERHAAALAWVQSDD